MSSVSWISVILVICGVMGARERATKLSNVQLCFLVVMCFLAYVLTRRYATMLSNGQKPSSDSTIALELNDSLYELYKPLDTPSMYVIFLHGLQSGDRRDPHLSTWKSGDGSCIWPQTWLTEKFPGAHVLCVSYSAHVKKNDQGEFDIYNIGENLLSDILQVNIGQVPYCPVILVGHCFGGFVIKELVNRAYDSFTRASDLRKKEKLKMLLENIRGIYYYGTPHHGSPLMDAKNHLESDLLKYFKLLSKDGARLNEKFEQLRQLYPKWLIYGLGENRSTKSGLFQGYVGAPEASSRAGESFHIVDADHIQICRPEKKTSRSFSGLVGLLEGIATDVKEEQARAQEEEAQAAQRSRLQNRKRLPKQITGIEAPVKDVKTKLDVSKTLGLVGMGGCGKTTLAKAVFNNLVSGFEYSAFVGEVKLISGREDDLKKEVWSQMHHFGKKMATNPDWSLLNQKRLLLVLDDVSSTDRDLQVLLDIAEDLSPESRFLVTSRDTDLLKTLDEVYVVPFLKEGIDKELFMRHAFPEKNAAPSQLASLVDAIVKKCDGLPLTLEIIGKYLYKRYDKQEWEQTLIALGRADSVTGLNEKLWEKLKLSFDGLQEEEQELFLDVATFFRGNNICTLGEAKVAWKAAFSPANEMLLWRTLVDRSLVYDVEDTETIQMHEQLCDLGRNIGAKRYKRRRICDQKEARDLLQATTQRDNEEIFALRLHKSRSAALPLRIARRTLLSLTKMRYLEVDANATISGDEEDEVESFLANLVFVNMQTVQWFFPPVDSDCSTLTHLVVLNLHNSEEDYLPESIGSLSALKILKFISCTKLQSLPESFGNLSALSTLQFTSCSDLQSLPISFGNLSALRTLQFTDCKKLRSLPDSFGNLSALSTLQFKHCPELQSLPDSFGNLSALSTLQFMFCFKLQSLPYSFGNLSALSTLQFMACLVLQSLPDSFGNLSPLSTLQFTVCNKLQSLPDSFGNLSALSTLQFTNCSDLQSLPISFGNLSALRTLQFTDCNKLQSLPDSFGNLSALSTLQFTECTKLRSLPDSFRNLSALSTLQFKHCPELQSLPDSFGNLSALSTLQFTDCYKLQSLPDSFGNLSALSALQFTNCSKLQSLPDSFGNLSALSTLQFQYCPELGCLPESFGRLSALSKLHLNCAELQTLPESFRQVFALQHLCIERVAVRSVPDSIRWLPSLQFLELGCLPFVKEFPPWLGKAVAGLRKMSRKTFDVRDGNFALNAQHEVGRDDVEELIRYLHHRVWKIVALSNLTVHCDKCGMYPLEWPRYECSPSSAQFCHVLCPNCFQQSGSNAPEYTCEDSPVHCFLSCDVCEMKPLKGPRYKSSTRFDFDLCRDCFRRRCSKASEYICSEPPVLSAGDGTTDILDAILDLDADDGNSEIQWSFERVQLRVFIFQERGILKRLVGDLRGALDDLNKALEIVLGQTSSEFDFLENARYTCLKHGAYVKFLLGDIDGARRDAQEALSIGWSEYCKPGVLHLSSIDALGSVPLRFLDFEMR